MCFRTKEAGILCVVQFDDAESAGKALEKLNGYALQRQPESTGEVRVRCADNPMDVGV